jgi:NTP pyrophosphatase (non-canonical NTP hydrolase)
MSEIKKPSGLVAYELLQSTTNTDLAFAEEWRELAKWLFAAVEEYHDNALGEDMADAMFALGELAGSRGIEFGDVAGTFYEYIENGETTCPDLNCDGSCEHNYCDARTSCDDKDCDGECGNTYCQVRE